MDRLDRSTAPSPWIDPWVSMATALALPQLHGLRLSTLRRSAVAASPTARPPRASHWPCRRGSRTATVPTAVPPCQARAAVSIHSAPAAAARLHHRPAPPPPSPSTAITARMPGLLPPASHHRAQATAMPQSFASTAINPSRPIKDRTTHFVSQENQEIELRSRHDLRPRFDSIEARMARITSDSF